MVMCCNSRLMFASFSACLLSWWPLPPLSSQHPFSFSPPALRTSTPPGAQARISLRQCDDPHGPRTPSAFSPRPEVKPPSPGHKKVRYGGMVFFFGISKRRREAEAEEEGETEQKQKKRAFFSRERFELPANGIMLTTTVRRSTI